MIIIFRFSNVLVSRQLVFVAPTTTAHNWKLHTQRERHFESARGGGYQRVVEVVDKRNIFVKTIVSLEECMLRLVCQVFFVWRHAMLAKRMYHASCETFLFIKKNHLYCSQWFDLLWTCSKIFVSRAKLSHFTLTKTTNSCSTCKPITWITIKIKRSACELKVFMFISLVNPRNTWINQKSRSRPWQRFFFRVNSNPTIERLYGKVSSVHEWSVKRRSAKKRREKVHKSSRARKTTFFFSLSISSSPWLCTPHENNWMCSRFSFIDSSEKRLTEKFSAHWEAAGKERFVSCIRRLLLLISWEASPIISVLDFYCLFNFCLRVFNVIASNRVKLYREQYSIKIDSIIFISSSEF